MILGSYSDLKVVKTRGVVQIVIEIPLQRGKEVTDLFGLPQPDAEVPVVVARMDPARLAEQQEPAQIGHANGDEDGKPPRPLSQVAAILGGIGSFQQFLLEETPGWSHRPTSEEATDWIRATCGVQSRKELDTNDVAAKRFRKVRAQYDAWLRDPVPA